MGGARLDLIASEPVTERVDWHTSYRNEVSGVSGVAAMVDSGRCRKAGIRAQHLARFLSGGMASARNPLSFKGTGTVPGGNSVVHNIPG